MFKSRAAQIAGLLALILVLWFGVNTVLSAASDEGEQAAEEGAETEAEVVPEVRVFSSVAQQHRPIIVLRGRTEPIRAVQMRAEVSGIVTELPFEEGDRVEDNDIVCQLSIESRQADLEEARARVEQNRLEYEAAQDLAERGVRSETQLAAAKASLDAARAALKRAELELERTKIRAPFNGVLNTRPVEPGDFMQRGDTCGTVVQLDPVLAVGQATEEDISDLKRGLPARVTLQNGRALEGTVRYVSAEAEGSTRTFKVEVSLPNPDRSVRAGVSATIRIRTEAVPAHRVSPSVLVLNDEGRLSVRTVDGGTVAVRPITIVDDAEEGVWVTGLPQRTDIVFVGDTTVHHGQQVEVVAMDDGADA